MYKALVVLSTLAFISACEDTSIETREINAQLATQCTSIVEAAPEARPEQLQSGMLARICTCYAGLVPTLGPDVERTHMAVWEAMIALKAETGLNGVEALGDEMLARIREAPEAFDFSSAEFSDAGSFVGYIGNEIEKTGKCPPN